MAELNPQIPLAALGTQRPLDLIGPMAQAVQLKGLLQQQQLGSVQLQEAQRQQAQGQLLRDVYAKYAGTPEFGGETMLQDIYRVAPEQGIKLEQLQAQQTKAQLDLRKSLIELRKADLEVQSTKLKQGRDLNSYFAEQLGRVTAGDQEGYERVKAETRDFLQQRGLPTTDVDQMPDMLDMGLINQKRQAVLSVEKQFEEAHKATEVQRAQAKKTALLPLEVEEARQKALAEEPSRLRIAAATGAIGAEKQAAGQIRAAEIARTEKPLEGPMAEKVSILQTVRAMTRDMAALYSPDFVGPVTGRLGAVREITGAISDQEVEFRRVIEDVKDSLLRARSGAQINESEYARLTRLVPLYTNQPNVFQARLNGFNRALEQAISERLKVETTGRAALPGRTAPPPLQRTMSEADISEAMRQTGWTRQQVLDAARQHGYQVPGQ